jgi:hypothetical protein
MYMRLFISIILLFVVSSCSNEQLSNLLNEDSLKYYPIYLNADQVMDSTYYYYPRLLNFSLDSIYFPKYPNPFSPSSFSPYIIKLTDTSDIKIELIDRHNNSISHFSSYNQPPGYYLFKCNFVSRYRGDNSDLFYYSNIRFTFMDSTYIAPLFSN